MGKLVKSWLLVSHLMMNLTVDPVSLEVTYRGLEMESPKIGDLAQSLKSSLDQSWVSPLLLRKPSWMNQSVWSCPPFPFKAFLAEMSVRQVDGSPNSSELRTPEGDWSQRWRGQTFVNLSPQEYHPVFLVSNPSSLIFDSSNQVLSKHLFKHFKWWIYPIITINAANTD